MEIPMSIPYAALPVGAALIILVIVLARLAGGAFKATAGENF
jgi:TRAP-type C4-dicarboxylate transport system permease small subunit